MTTRVIPGSGAVFTPNFDAEYRVSSFTILDGGTGYASTDPPKIEVLGTKTPLEYGEFYPIIANGAITQIAVLKPGKGYFPAEGTSDTKVGIVTTEYVESSLRVTKFDSNNNPYVSVASTESHVVMYVSSGKGSAIFENGYNRTIEQSGYSGLTAPITPNYSGNQNRFWGFFDPFPSYFTTGLGTDAKFNAFIVYDSFTGDAISTSLVLRSGGLKYSIGDQVSISGTYFGGNTPANDISFTVSNTTNTRVGAEANNNYVGVPGETVLGTGSGVILTLTRDSLGDIDEIEVTNGGAGYALTSIIGISGTYIGGITPGDDLKLAPEVLGADSIPSVSYIQKTDDNGFRVTGLSTGSPFITLRNFGIGTHSFTYENPNASSIVLVDNIIQSGLFKRDLIRTLTQPININTTTLYLSGITSITSLDTIQVDSEYFDVKDVELNGPNTVEVVRGTMGSEVGYHTVGAAVTVLRGDFNIVRDEINFKSAPFGPIGPEGLEINSSFNGRIFSRQVDYGSSPNDQNVIFDDISTKFVGASSTEFFLTSNTKPLVGIFTDTSAVLIGGIDANLNPLVLINNIPQISGTDFDVDNDRLQLEKGNRIKFLTGTPGAGKISRTVFNSGLGYQRLIGAGGTVVVGAGGTILSVDIQQSGSGYRSAPQVEVESQVGSGASLVANIGVGGVITSIDIIEPGTGYATTLPPKLEISIPTGYSDIPLEYVNSPPGEGTGAKASVVVGNRGDIIGFEMEDPGIYYKIGDRLRLPTSELLTSTDSSTVNVINLLYENTTGITTVITDSPHGLIPDDYLRLSGVAMTCESWSGFTTFTINSFKYEETAGICTITTEIPHGLPEGDYIQLEDIRLTCISDYSGITSTIFPYPAGINTFGDAYPQSSPNTLGGTYNVFRSITGTSGTTIVFNAGISTIAHFYESGSLIQNITPTDAYYDPLSGEFTVTSIGHTVTTDNRIQLLEGGFAFTCSMDNNATEHYLPESDHFAIGRLLQVTGVTTDTFTAYVGAAGAGDFYTPSNAVYNTSTGDITLTLGNHNVSMGDTIFIQDNALTFTCDMDANQAQKTYPRPGIDPFANRGIEVTGIAGTTVTINVGSAGDNLYLTPTDANYNPVTGDMTVTVGQHGLSVGRNVVLVDNSFTFTCALDGHGTQHNYPRPGIDPFAGKSIPITNVGLTKHTVTNATYNPTLGVISFNIPKHGFNNSDYVKVYDNSLQFTCDLDGNSSIKAYPRPNYDYPSGRWMIISNRTDDTFEINVGVSTYTGNHTFISADPYGLVHQDGTFTINVGTGGTDTSEHIFVSAASDAIEHRPQANHTFIGASTNSIARNPSRYFTPYNATYNPISGDAVLEIGKHPFTKGEGIVLRPNSLSFTCDMDNNQSVKSYPRPGIDPFASRSIPVKDFTPTTITLNVGASGPNKYFTPTDANYNPATGDLTVTVGQHGLGVGRNVVLGNNSFTFTCALDGYATEHTYPRPGSDPYAGRSIAITSVGVTTHTATDAPYNAASGVVTLEVVGHGFNSGDYVLIEDNSLRYSCDLDGNSQWKYYPRPNYDYPSGRWIPIFNVTNDTFDITVGNSSYTGNHTFISATADGIKKQDGTFTINVGDSGNGPIARFTPSDATYNPATGDFVITLNGHSLTTSNTISFAPESFVFTCDMDGNKTEHALPEIGQPAYENILGITTTTTNTITVNVGASGTDVEFTPTDAVYDTASGDLILIIGNHNLSIGEGVVISDNSLTFTCDMDANQAQKTYPRPGIDPFASRSIPITGTSSTSITINAGVAGTNIYLTPTAVDYSPVTGDMTVTVGQHGLGVGRNVVLEDDSFTFTCALDGHATEHTYPRPGTDPYAGKSIEITSVGLTTHTTTDAPYDAASGVVTLEVVSHGFSNGDFVKISDNALTYTCDLDGNVELKSYPRSGYDYPSGRWLRISNVTSNTFQINVGPSSYTGTHTFIAASSTGKLEHQDGTFTINVGTSSDTSEHIFRVAESGAIKHEPQAAHTFVSAAANSVKHLPQSTHTFVRTSNDSLSVYSESGSPHNFIRSTTNAIKHEPQSNHTFIAGIPYSVRQDIQAPHTFVRSSDDSISVYSYNGTATIGITSTLFPYPGASYNTVGDTFDVFTALDGTEDSKIVINTGISTIAHDYDFGGTVTNTPFTEFVVTVDDAISDKFSGFYPGQFIQFDDVSRLFNGRKKKFTLTVTEGNETKVLSLKTKRESDMKMENNLFVFINDVLQQPYYSYIWNGSRIVFKEAPLRNSKCTILFFRGSDLDVIQVDPPETIKEGDIIQIGENRLDPEDREQFERVVKKIISTDTLDTFTYDSLGINTDPTSERPLRWKKQTQDRIINGVLYSKARPSLRSRVAPITRLIKSVEKDDVELYVNNAFPLFTDVDKLQESLRNINIVKDTPIRPALVESTVNTASSVEALSITDVGSGYDTIVNPVLVISSSLIKRKDPIYIWNGLGGVSDNFNFNAVLLSTPIVAVGSSNILGISTNGTEWQESTIGYGSTEVIDFNSIAFAPTDNFIAVGNTATIVRGSGIGGTSMTWTEMTRLKETFSVTSPTPTITPSSYTGDLNEVIYSTSKDMWIAIGDNRGVFTSSGISSTRFFEKTPPSLGNLNSVAANSTLIIAVGENSSIIYSDNGNIWTQVYGIPSTRNLNHIIWNERDFIAVGNQGTILRSSTGTSDWVRIVPSLIFNFTKIRYEYGMYFALSDSGQLYYSLNLEEWIYRDTNTTAQLTDLRFIPEPPPAELRNPNVPVLSNNGRFVAVGLAGTSIYSEPVYNRATGIATVTDGSVASVTITNPGFGYDLIPSPPVIVESDTIHFETVRSIKVVGDFGLIRNVSVGNSFINFDLESERYDNSSLGIGYSSLNTYGVNFSEIQVGDYFVITESNTVVGQALTGITTYSGGLNNYPESKVGTAQSGGTINGVYRAERITQPESGIGIVTVRCMFAYGSEYSGQPITAFVDTTANTNGIFGRYSWGKIFDYQNRRTFDPKDFIVNNDDGMVGLSTAPQVYRTRTIK
jgi:hypothetical protein